MAILNQEHKIRLTTVSPLSIGADKGRELSPLADYILSDDEKEIYLLPQSVLEPYFREKPQLIGEFSAGIIKNMDNNRSDFDLKSFITHRLGVDTTQLPKVVSSGVSKNSRLNIAAIVKDAGRPFLPGSSLKGAFRTAILYHWLLNTPNGETAMQNTYKAMDTWFNSNDRRAKKDAEKQMFNEETLFQFGKRDVLPLASQLLVRDSTPLSINSLGVTNARRIRLKALKKEAKASNIPQPRESIRIGIQLQTAFSVQIGKILDNSALGFLNKSTESILKIIAQHAAAFVDFEIEELTQCELSKSADIKKMLDFYYDLQERMRGGETFVRMGLGKTFYDNSLVLALLNHEKDRKKAYDNYEDWGDVFKKEIKNLYPVTRTVTADGLPFGWVKIAKI